MTVRSARRIALAGATGLALLAGAATLAGCTSKPVEHGNPPGPHPGGTGMQLVAYTSCADAVAQLRRAAKAAVGPYGFPGGAMLYGGARTAVDAAADKASAAGGAVPDAAAHSGTNVHESGVDEPDVVKTDGRRIVTIAGGVLRVVDVRSRAQAARLDLRADQNDPIAWDPPTLLLAGDRALVLAAPAGDPLAQDGRLPRRPAGPRLLLVDLAGTPKVIGRYRTDGQLVDARQVGTTVRVVVRSTPRVVFPLPGARKGNDAALLRANRAVLDKAPVDAWLPRYEVSGADGQPRTGTVPCERLSRPATYTGGSLVTVLSFDLGGPLGDGDPVTVLADGETVYSTATSLYVANDERWRSLMRSALPADRAPKPPKPSTQLFKFDITGTARPRYLAAGTVDGWLINQYALSEWGGHLRVATTTGDPVNRGTEGRRSESAVHVLRQNGGALAETGSVGGLGRGEQIFGVRFAGPTGYVVTFRQTDPLYVVDLRDPAAPKVTGELKITGYSAYLHPLDGGRLIGIGQEATAQGQRQGTQVSLFDVADPARPTRLARYLLPQASSTAEFDPHAFLYWPADGTLVIPMTVYGTGGIIADERPPATAAVVLRVSGASVREVGRIEHPRPATPESGLVQGAITRSLVIGDALWTVSDAGAMASSLNTAAKAAWVPWQ